LIGVTQPRRVAAISTAQRVADELNTTCSAKGLVGYQIRYDSTTVGPQTKVKFMTDGILMREIQQDLLLRKYSVILLDEAHERNLNTDILIGLLSRIIPLRNRLAKDAAIAAAQQPHQGGSAARDTLPLAPLKLVIMSATLRVEDFTQNRHLFAVPPPVVHVKARQFPVAVHFAKKTELDDYVNEAYKCVHAMCSHCSVDTHCVSYLLSEYKNNFMYVRFCRKAVKIHTRLPEGGILMFLTGQDEIDDVVRRLTERFAPRRRKMTGKAADLSDATAEASPAGTDDVSAATKDKDGKVTDNADEEEAESEVAQPVVVLPLYALLSKTAQAKVFEPVRAGHRLIVVATNVAETSITIPGIR
jgi:ATP-dependent RNA helicase DHX37/DHR1